MKHVFRFLAMSDGTNWVVSGEEHQHLSRVLRIKEGEPVEFFDGLGNIGQGKVRSISKSQTLILQESITSTPPRERSLEIAIGALKPKTMDDLIPSLVELGCDHLHIFLQDGFSSVQMKVLLTHLIDLILYFPAFQRSPLLAKALQFVRPCPVPTRRCV